jgi:hypothetical protein
MLRDETFLETYFKTLTARLTKAYEHCTRIMTERGIPYTAS